MAIREFSPEGSPRTKIAFVGHMPPSSDLRQFEIREFSCEEFTVEQLCQSENIAQLAALIWTQRSERPNELPRQIRSIVPALLNSDVPVYIRLAKEDESRPSIARRLVVDALRESRLPTANLFPEEWRALPPDLGSEKAAVSCLAFISLMQQPLG